LGSSSSNHKNLLKERTTLFLIFMLPPLLDYDAFCIRAKSVLTGYLINRLLEFHQIYNFGAVGDKGGTG